MGYRLSDASLLCQRTVPVPTRYRSRVYGTCSSGEDTGCAPPLEIQNWPECARAGNRVIAFFALAHVEVWARRVHRDAGLRARLAPVLGLSADDFLENAAGAIRDAVGWGGMTSSSPGEIANILQFGTARPE
ncbi:MAG: hypothetical protein QOC78_758 [Solirubrobacteraceae bacterium]|jgi:hypothetical protein|nr:hypothetical protein [Solirubrobacteraceae bacterium]